jgi:hypothetical protein
MAIDIISSGRFTLESDSFGYRIRVDPWLVSLLCVSRFNLVPKALAEGSKIRLSE